MHIAEFAEQLPFQELSVFPPQELGSEFSASEKVPAQGFYFSIDPGLFRRGLQCFGASG